jgi:hypothetical protein
MAAHRDERGGAEPRRTDKEAPPPGDAIVKRCITTAVAEKLSALMTADHLEERAAPGDRGRFERVLARVRDVPLDEGDAPGDG